MANHQTGTDVTLGMNVIIEDGAVIGNHVYIDHNTIIRSGCVIGDHSVIGANCILGDYGALQNRNELKKKKLIIGKNATIRSDTIIYTDSAIGDYFQTGNKVCIRERSSIGNHVSIGTLSDIQGYCDIGNYVRIHSSVHVGQKTAIRDYVWVFPHVVFTNDTTPPSNELVGATIQSFAILATGSVILPGISIGEDSMVAAGAVVTKDVEKYAVVGGIPAKKIADIRSIKNHVTGKPAYPWRYHFDRYMPWEGTGYDAWLQANRQ